MKKRKIILMLDSSRAADRGFIRGIINYANLRGEWDFYRFSPLFQKMPFSGNSTSDEIWQKLINLDADGLIGYLPDDKILLNKIHSQSFPTVAIPVSTLNDGIINLSQDINTGIMAAEYLIGLGFKNFGFCGMKYSWSKIRERSFSQTICSANFNYSIAPDDSVDKDCLIKWLKSLKIPVAIMACNDERAYKLVETCRVCNLKIPSQVAIIGVDNDDMICSLSNPPITSIEMNFEAVGYNAAEIIDKMLIGRKAIDTSELTCRPIRIIKRASTDILEINDEEVANAIHYIRNNVRRSISVSDVQKNSLLSLRALQLRFHKVLNRGISEEIRRERIAEMTRQLVKTDLTIEQIAYRMEFNNIKNISRIFKKETGMTPFEYRKKMCK